jgi:predicted dehydrogenase
VGIGVAVVGFGRWGPNHARNLDEMDRCQLRWVCDQSTAALDLVKRTAGAPQTTDALERVLDDPAVQAVVIATPAPTHEALAAACLNAGKHVLVEKPLCHELEAARRLARVAERADRRLHVGHICVHQAGVRRVGRLIAEGELGALLAVEAERSSQPPALPGVNVLWDLGVHDISIINAWIGAAPVRVTAVGGALARGVLEDEVHASLEFPGGTLARLRVSWRGPVKVRRCAAIGERATASFDDLAGAAPVQIDAGDGPRPVGELEPGQPLRRELEHFLDAIETSTPSPNDASAGVEVVRTLTAMERSMRAGGGWVELS